MGGTVSTTGRETETGGIDTQESIARSPATNASACAARHAVRAAKSSYGSDKSSYGPDKSSNPAASPSVNPASSSKIFTSSSPRTASPSKNSARSSPKPTSSSKIFTSPSKIPTVDGNNGSKCDKNAEKSPIPAGNGQKKTVGGMNGEDNHQPPASAPDRAYSARPQFSDRLLERFIPCPRGRWWWVKSRSRSTPACTPRSAAPACRRPR